MSFLSSDSVRPTSGPAHYEGTNWGSQQQESDFGQDVPQDRIEWEVVVGRARSLRNDEDNISTVHHSPLHGADADRLLQNY